MLDEQHERRIAHGLRDGKTDAWQALYDAYAERVWRGVARLLGPHSTDVADVVQETMMAAARSAATFDAARFGPGSGASRTTMSPCTCANKNAAPGSRPRAKHN